MCLDAASWPANGLAAVTSTSNGSMLPPMASRDRHPIASASRLDLSRSTTASAPVPIDIPLALISARPSLGRSRHDLTVIDRFTAACQHEADRCHLGQVGCTDRSALGHDRVDARVEQPDQGVEDVRVCAGSALRHAYDAHKHHRAHVVYRHRVADPAGVHGEQLVLVVDHVLGQDLAIAHVSNVCVEAVNLAAPFQRPLHDCAGPAYPLAPHLRHIQPRPVNRDLVHFLGGHRPIAKVHGRQLRVAWRHRASRTRRVPSSAAAPASMCSGAVHSSGQWLRPPADGTKSMPTGPRRAIWTASWPAPLRRETKPRPSLPIAFVIADITSSEATTGSVRDRRRTLAETPRREPASAADCSNLARRSSSQPPSMLRNSAHISAFPGTTLAAPRKTSSRPVVPTPPAEARRSTASTASAAALNASCRAAIGVVPAWPAWPVKVAWSRSMPAIPETIPSGMPASSRTGPCSMCSSTKAQTPPDHAAPPILSGSPPADAIASASVRPDPSREAM